MLRGPLARRQFLDGVLQTRSQGDVGPRLGGTCAAGYVVFSPPSPRRPLAPPALGCGPPRLHRAHGRHHLVDARQRAIGLRHARRDSPCHARDVEGRQVLFMSTGGLDIFLAGQLTKSCTPRLGARFGRRREPLCEESPRAFLPLPAFRRRGPPRAGISRLTCRALCELAPPGRPSCRRLLELPPPRRRVSSPPPLGSLPPPPTFSSRRRLGRFRPGPMCMDVLMHIGSLASDATERHLRRELGPAIGVGVPGVPGAGMTPPRPFDPPAVWVGTGAEWSA